MDVKSRKAERSEQTRRALIAVARELFAGGGFADTPTEEIVQRADVTRGALYHHFSDKRALFQAVFEELEQEVLAGVVAAASAYEDPWEAMRAGHQAFLDACLDPAVQRIMLLDAPSVLGLDTWRGIEARYGLGLIQGGLQAAMDAGLIDRQPVEPLAHLVLGAMNEAGLLIARADDVRRTRDEVGATLARLMDGLRKR